MKDPKYGDAEGGNRIGMDINRPDIEEQLKGTRANDDLGVNEPL
jgi:hypothetical protein